MNKEVASQIFEKLQKYDLSNIFKSKEELKKWLLSLNQKQINNFLSLNMEKEKINFPLEMLINLNLLNCEDYQKKLEAFCNIKNADSWHHLFNELLNPTFLNSTKFYDDIEMLSKAKMAQYVLWIIGNDDFINSPYHDEDLKLLVESRDCNKDNPVDFVVWDAIATVAGDKNSINSPYHRDDMRIMIEAGSNCLQTSSSYPEGSLNNLAVNPISLRDKYHIENMKILADHPEYGECLYKLMTNEVIINGKFYREEINALANAKDETAARCLFYYIFNPHNKYYSDNGINSYFMGSYMLLDRDSEELSYYEMREIGDKPIIETPDVYWKVDNSFEIKEAQRKYSKLKLLPEYDYLNGLKIILNAPKNYNFFYASLLMNKYFALSPNRSFDLEILKNINIKKVSDKFLFVEIYKLMTKKTFQESPYHKKDLEIIINSIGENKQNELIKLAKNEKNISSINHGFDMNFLSNLDMENIDKKIMNKIKYYIYGDGLYDANHIEILNRLQFMESIDEYNQSMKEDIFGEVLTELDKSKQEQTEKVKSKILQKIKKLFN
ncbi:MAG: hypothetical protein Q4E75_00960 [bacterium]|nr:hypothetical protein [bacterium]